jgi:hypothetical protein
MHLYCKCCAGNDSRYAPNSIAQAACAQSGISSTCRPNADKAASIRARLVGGWGQELGVTGFRLGFRLGASAAPDRDC